MRKLSRKAASRVYEAGLLRALGRVVRRFSQGEFNLPSEPRRVHPVYGWQDGRDFIHLVAVNADGPVSLTLWKGDMKAMLADESFTRYELSPDPTIGAEKATQLVRQDLLPRRWEKDIVTPEDSAEG